MRFWHSLGITDKPADVLTKCIENELDKVTSNSPCKLIVQPYDGANSMSSINNGIQTEIQLCSFRSLLFTSIKFSYGKSNKPYSKVDFSQIYLQSLFFQGLLIGVMC